MSQILLVEDNDGDVFLIKEAYKTVNPKREIISLEDGERAIEYLSSLNIDKYNERISLVLLDINLPKKNGQEVLQFIKSTEYLKHIPVIMLTASSSQTDITEAYKNSASSFITKPNDVVDFEKKITEIEQYWFGITQLAEL